MDNTLIGAAVAFILQFGLLWYRLGRVEGKVSEITREIHNGRIHKKRGGEHASK